MENLTTWFIGITGLAVLLQAGVLLMMYLSMRKSSARMEAIATEVKTKAIPALESTQTILTEIRPKLQVIADNLEDATTHLRAQVHRVDATVTDIIDRTRLQVIRADEFVNSTMDKLEETREAVQRTVVSPVRHISGLMHGVTAGVEAFFSRRRDRESVNVPQDEMFI